MSVQHLVILAAAGSGRRFGDSQPKQYLPLAGRSVLEQCALRFVACDWVARISIAIAPDDSTAQSLPQLQSPPIELLRCGGPTRRDTVLAALRSLRERGVAGQDDWIWVHDAARPGIDAAALERLRAALADEPVGALLALPVVDTVRRAATGAESVARSEATVDRDRLWLAQTPQVFRCDVLLDALERFPGVTDEAAAIEAAGLRPRLVAGSRANLKITSRDDLEWMCRLMEER